jgi:hypothetical protein
LTECQKCFTVPTNQVPSMSKLIEEAANSVLPSKVCEAFNCIGLCRAFKGPLIDSDDLWHVKKTCSQEHGAKILPVRSLTSDATILFPSL